MKECPLRLLILLVCCFGVAQIADAQTSTSQNVVYGEVGYIKAQSPQKVFRVFLDRNGHLYPDALIPDDAMRAHNASLWEWSIHNPRDFGQILYDYAIDGNTGTHEQHFETLQQKVAQAHREQIQLGMHGSGTLNVLVHGFRKAVHSGQSSRTSVDDLRSLREALMKVDEPDDFYLEVYWDGTFDCCFGTKLKENARLFELFETEARHNAVAAGYGLRRVVSDLQIPNLNVVTHSLGARVGMSLLFEAYSQTDLPGEKWLTPQQKQVKVLLIAPAIDGKEEFSHYQDRCSKLPFTEEDNYEVMVVFNRKDFVLRKKDPMLYLFGPGARGKGSTRLGCDRGKMINKVQRKLQSLGAPDALQTIDFRSMGRCHLIKCYVRHPLFEGALEFLK